jgi:hypothetical protein
MEVFDFPRLLRLGGERRGQEAESEGDKDFEGAAVHGAVLQNVPQDHRSKLGDLFDAPFPHLLPFLL